VAGARAFSVNEIIDQQPLSRFQIATISLCGLVLLLDGFDTQCIGFLAPPISEALGIPLRRFGPVFSSALLGLMIAAMAMGPVADRWGRKWPVVFSTLTFAVFALLTARAVSLRELIVLRFLTGLGLGGAMPNVVALTSEYSPKRLQAVFVGALFCGMPLGALVGGLASSVSLRADLYFWERRVAKEAPATDRRHQRIQQPNSVRVAVSDTGSGIAAEHHQEIFEDFVRVDRTSSGMGLGLAIAKRLVQAHRGKIWVDSELRRGCTFTFLLPIDSQST